MNSAFGIGAFGRSVFWTWCLITVCFWTLCFWAFCFWWNLLRWACCFWMCSFWRGPHSSLCVFWFHEYVPLTLAYSCKTCRLLKSSSNMILTFVFCLFQGTSTRTSNPPFQNSCVLGNMIMLFLNSSSNSAFPLAIRVTFIWSDVAVKFAMDLL